MNATIDLLHDRGIARTSTPEIARLAGVSRGALTHHFASREAIISASVADLLGGVTRDLHRFAEDFVVRGGSSDEIVDYIWTVMSDRLFYVTLEYLPEARHNPDFKADLVPVVRDFHAGPDAVWTALASRTGARSGPHARRHERHDVPGARHDRTNGPAQRSALLRGDAAFLEIAGPAAFPRVPRMTT